MSQPITRENFDEWMIPVYVLLSLYRYVAKVRACGISRGKEYIDFAGGIAVNALGHAHPEPREALNEQASSLGIPATVTPTSRYCDWRKN